MASEYFIREAESDQAQGPYQVEQLLALVEAGKVTRATLFFHKAMDSWVALGDESSLSSVLFPEKKKLSLRSEPRTVTPTVATAESLDTLQAKPAVPKVQVADLLAAAEAESEDTRYLKEEQALQELAASKAPTVLSVLLVCAGVGYLPMLLGQEGNLWGNPFLYLAAFDLLLALLAALSVTEIFPLIRIRAGAFFGFLGYLAYVDLIDGIPLAVLQIVCLGVFSISLFVVSFTLHYRWMMAHWVMGSGAILTYAFVRYGNPLTWF